MSLNVPRERLFLYAILTALTAFSIDALLPGLHDIGLELGSASPLSTQHIVSLFILGIYAIGTLVALVASSLEAVIVGRFLTRRRSGGAQDRHPSHVRDRFEGEAMARVMSLLFSIFSYP